MYSSPFLEQKHNLSRKIKRLHAVLMQIYKSVNLTLVCLRGQKSAIAFIARVPLDTTCPYEYPDWRRGWCRGLHRKTKPSTA